MRPPETYSPWVFMAWLLTHSRRLFIQQWKEDPADKTMKWVFTALSELPPAEMLRWGERLFHDPTTPVLPMEEWLSRPAAKPFEAP